MIRFWRWLTTSRYTRHLEDENRELKHRISALESVLIPRLASIQERAREIEKPAPQKIPAYQVPRLCTECGSGIIYNGKCKQCGEAYKPQVLNKGRRGWPTIRRELENETPQARKQ